MDENSELGYCEFDVLVDLAHEQDKDDVSNYFAAFKCSEDFEDSVSESSYDTTDSLDFKEDYETRNELADMLNLDISEEDNVSVHKQWTGIH